MRCERDGIWFEVYFLREMFRFFFYLVGVIKIFFDYFFVNFSEFYFKL